MEQIFVVLTPEQLKFIKKKMAPGKYKTRTQALKTGLRRLKKREAQKRTAGSSLRVAPKAPALTGHVH